MKTVFVIFYILVGAQTGQNVATGVLEDPRYYSSYSECLTAILTDGRPTSAKIKNTIVHRHLSEVVSVFPACFSRHVWEDELAGALVEP